MKLKRLWINGFKNLNNFELDFTDKNGITVLIGNNGSGKSNVLEAISAIFADLYNIRNSRRKKLSFSYKIDYEIDDFYITLNYIFENEGKEYFFGKYDINYKLEEINNFILEHYLPSNIIMIYSGDDVKIREQYYEPFRKKFQNSIRESQTIPNLPKMLYLDKFFWTISLLALLKSDLDDSIEFCKKILKNYSLSNIEIYFVFNQNLIQNNISFLNYLSNGKEEKVFALDEFKTIDYIPNEKDLFIQLASMVGKRNQVKRLVIKNNGIDTIHLSEGEKKQILIKAALEILANENSLILMDEPDSHIHVANKEQIKTIIKNRNRETILTTHSPTLTHAFELNHIEMLSDGKIEEQSKQEIFAQITNGIWSYQEQSIFLSSKKEIILLVEGKQDKIHILEAFKRLKSDYEDLDFDIFNLRGANSIAQFMNGMKTSSEVFDESKKYIGIFDYDEAGKSSFYGNSKGKKYTSLKGHKNFYHIYLPFKNNNEDFEIEHMYPELRLKEAYKKAIDSISSNINKNTIESAAKAILAKECINFNNSDFEYFKKLFDLIKKIKGLYNGNS